MTTDPLPLFAVTNDWLPIIAPLAGALNPGGQCLAPQGEPAPFDIDGAADAEPAPTELEAVEWFNHELQAAIDAVDWSQPF